jgi:hypothetical protein
VDCIIVITALNPERDQHLSRKAKIMTVCGTPLSYDPEPLTPEQVREIKEKEEAKIAKIRRQKENHEAFLDRFSILRSNHLRCNHLLDDEHKAFLLWFDGSTNSIYDDGDLLDRALGFDGDTGRSPSELLRLRVTGNTNADELLTWLQHSVLAVLLREYTNKYVNQARGGKRQLVRSFLEWSITERGFDQRTPMLRVEIRDTPSLHAKVQPYSFRLDNPYDIKHVALSWLTGDQGDIVEALVQLSRTIASRLLVQLVSRSI